MSTTKTRASVAVRSAVLTQLTRSAGPERVTTISNAELRASTGYGARWVEYALSALLEDGRIEVAYTRTRQRVIKLV